MSLPCCLKLFVGLLISKNKFNDFIFYQKLSRSGDCSKSTRSLNNLIYRGVEKKEARELCLPSLIIWYAHYTIIL
ncbi:hypothetical protein V6Z11_D11G391800 [Gossypium hirsutum]